VLDSNRERQGSRPAGSAFG